MKIIHGPSYRYQGERLHAPEIIWIQDHHYDPDHGHALRQLLDHSLCTTDQHLLVFDHVLIQDEFGQYPHVCLPLLLAAETEEFNREAIVPDWGRRTHAFNFMINKPRPHRQIMMDVILEHRLTNYKHTLCWAGGYGMIPGTDYRFGDERIMDRGLRNGHHANASTYNRLLRAAVFEPTTVSLITEPAFVERETIITEKTLMAIWAGTLPVWVGGWRCADTMKHMGFDVFDDVIDHSYQSLADPQDRCRQAVVMNLAVLSGMIDLAPFQERLQHNLNLLRSNPFRSMVWDRVRDHPELASIVNHYRGGLLTRS